MNRVFLLLIGLSLFAQDSTRAATIYSQTTPNEPETAFSSQNRLGSQRVANSFILTRDTPVMVKSLSFLGGYGLTAPPPSAPELNDLPSDAFRITFLEDDGGKPGAIFAEGDFSGLQVETRSPTGGPLLNGIYDPVEYGINLGSGILLSPSTMYWISVSNYAGDEFFWVWARANGLAGSQVASTFGDVTNSLWQVGASGMWFELNSTPIPEPSSFMLLMLTIPSVYLCCSRRISRTLFNG